MDNGRLGSPYAAAEGPGHFPEDEWPDQLDGKYVHDIWAIGGSLSKWFKRLAMRKCGTTRPAPARDRFGPVTCKPLLYTLYGRHVIHDEMWVVTYALTDRHKRLLAVWEYGGFRVRAGSMIQDGGGLWNEGEATARCEDLNAIRAAAGSGAWALIEHYNRATARWEVW